MKKRQKVLCRGLSLLKILHAKNSPPKSLIMLGFVDWERITIALFCQDEKKRKNNINWYIPVLAFFAIALLGTG